MMKHLVGYLLVFFFCLNSFGQGKIVVEGKITDAVTGKPIENVHIKVQQQNVLSLSNQQGDYHFSFYAKKQYVALIFSHTSYTTVYEPLNTQKDTFYLNVKLIPKVEELKGVNITSEKKPEIVFKSAKVSISDYEFYDERFIFLAYEKRLNKDSEIYLVDENETIIDKHFVSGEPVELYTDYLGNVNLICEKAVYRVGVDKDKLSLMELPLDDFNQLIKPIVDTLDGNLIFSDFLQQFPRFKYYAFNPTDTSIKIIKEVVHKDMDHQYNFEYHSLNNSEKQFAKRMAKRFKGLDKYDIAASMTGFSSNFLYEEVYAPLFIINDTIHIFDHSENKIWKFIDDTVQVAEVPFSYHQPKRKSEWKRRLIADEINGKIYGMFLRNGYNYLKEINTYNGKVELEKKLTYQFVDKIKIKDGMVYYTYKPQQTLQKKFLYKEWIE
ncbi:MAG: carboxypeptidase-like regulatory domain-containing protein [Vicingus serpentipes]|nr:carboxypeptidase-like regulatory domain-containing protein [Vicingus serpentipes]